jgi:hypothetical protein
MSIKQTVGAHKAPLIVTAAVVVTGMLHSFFWETLTQHGLFRDYWWVPGDIWATYRTAHWIGWGAYGSLYSGTGAYLTTPGIALVLAPVAMFTHALGMSESFPYSLMHPAAWLVLGPVEMLLGCSALFGLDALGRTLGVEGRSRWMLCAVEGVLLWQVTVLWGHPEDPVAIAFAAYAIVAALEGKRSRSAWLLGAGIAFQPLVVVVLPLIVGRSGMKKATAVVARAAGPSVAMLIVPFASNFHDTWVAVVEQPTELSFARVTAWTRFAPVIAKGTVSCGPTRVVAVAGACGVGFLVLRGRHRCSPATMVWCAAVCLALRFVMESAEEPYYIWPALALFVLASVSQHRARFRITCLLGVGLTVASYVDYTHTWMWWGVCVLGLVLMSISSTSSRALGELRSKARPVAADDVDFSEDPEPFRVHGRVLIAQDERGRDELSLLMRSEAGDRLAGMGS